jgi:non-heme chloroperoxidase
MRITAHYRPHDRPHYRHRPALEFRLRRGLRLLLAVFLLTPALAQQSSLWQDPSRHRAEFVTVESGVRLEVLDWGGSGRALVLLTGSGNTAHVFDEFAGKLTGFAHVYGITRRGFGTSSHPESGYTDQRLADDVLHVLDALKLVAPVLAGHSMGGNELTTLGSQHSDRVGGLVYLDAGADPKDFPASDPAYMALAGRLPPANRLPLPPTFPESESRASTADYQSARRALKAIGEGTKKRDYSNIRAPVLSLFATFRPAGDPLRHDMPKDPQERAVVEAFEAATMVYIKKYENSLLTAVPNARIVELPGANHYIFLSNEADVLREITAFVAHMPSRN